MLIALSVKNFKSIRQARVRFGPFTCFIGHNGGGKSNLFDAVNFLSRLADRAISEAAVEVRRTGSDGHSPLDLIFGWDPSRAIALSADMIVPPQVNDGFDQPAKPSTTLLRYTLRLRYDPESNRMLVDYESLTHAKLGDYRGFARFESAQSFKKSVALGSRRGGPFISTTGERIMLHGDRGSHGRPTPVGRSPLTVVGGTNTSDYPTVLAAKREMSSWRVLHLEPSAMRRPDPRWTQPHGISSSGARIPATLHALITRDPDSRSEIVYRLRQLNSDIEELGVHVDRVGDQLALRARITGLDKWLYARSLSDGTLRHIALALMLVDVRDRAVLCMEEPENGIHPSRVPNLVELLRDYAVDTQEEVAFDNPLRQVILNSHSPEVARQLSFDDIVFVERALTSSSGPASVFRPIQDTWRVDLPNGEQTTALPISKQSLADFIGGSPVGDHMAQSQLDFGKAR